MFNKKILLILKDVAQENNYRPQNVIQEFASDSTIFVDSLDKIYAIY
jgi:hypothetical protein